MKKALVLVSMLLCCGICSAETTSTVPNWVVGTWTGTVSYFPKSSSSAYDSATFTCKVPRSGSWTATCVWKKMGTMPVNATATSITVNSDSEVSISGYYYSPSRFDWTMTLNRNGSSQFSAKQVENGSDSVGGTVSQVTVPDWARGDWSGKMYLHAGGGAAATDEAAFDCKVIESGSWTADCIWYGAGEVTVEAFATNIVTTSSSEVAITGFYYCPNLFEWKMILKKNGEASFSAKQVENGSDTVDGTGTAFASRVRCHYPVIRGTRKQPILKPNSTDHYFDVDLFDVDTAPGRKNDASGEALKPTRWEISSAASWFTVDGIDQTKNEKPSSISSREYWYSSDSVYHPLIVTPSTSGTFTNTVTLTWADSVQQKVTIIFIIAEPETLPSLDDDATPAQVESALEEASDTTLVTYITNAVDYASFRSWASGIGIETVMSSSTAWCSYALDSTTLLAQAPQDSDLTIEAFSPSTADAGTYEFTVSVKDVTIGSAASDDRLKTIFGLKGGSDLNSLSADKVNLTFGTPKDGKLRFTAGPKNTSETVFFMQTKVN